MEVKDVQLETCEFGYGGYVVPKERVGKIKERSWPLQLAVDKGFDKDQKLH